MRLFQNTIAMLLFIYLFIIIKPFINRQNFELEQNETICKLHLKCRSRLMAINLCVLDMVKKIVGRKEENAGLLFHHIKWLLFQDR